MNTLKNIAVKLVLGTVGFGFIMTAGSASAFDLDPSILELVNKLVVDMKTKTMGELYPTMPLKDQMRGKMMIERASKNYLQDVIQPQMMSKNIAELKPKLMDGMVNK